MQREKDNIIAGVDIWLVLLFAILIFAGWLNIYAASTTEKHYEMLEYLRNKFNSGDQLTIRGINKSGIVDVKSYGYSIKKMIFLSV